MKNIYNRKKKKKKKKADYTELIRAKNNKKNSTMATNLNL